MTTFNAVLTGKHSSKIYTKVGFCLMIIKDNIVESKLLLWEKTKGDMHYGVQMMAQWKGNGKTKWRYGPPALWCPGNMNGPRLVDGSFDLLLSHTNTNKLF